MYNIKKISKMINDNLSILIKRENLYIYGNEQSFITK